MRRYLGLAIIAGFSLTSSSFPGFAADTKSTDTPSTDPTTQTDKDKDQDKEKKKKNKDKRKDPDEIGNRDVARGPNFYPLDKEIALGKQLAQDVERQGKIM